MVQIITLVGPSGVGKTSVLEQLQKLDRQWSYPLSTTTRAPRPEEVDGGYYHFLTEMEFNQALFDKEFVEHAEVHGTKYGLRKEDIEVGWEQGIEKSILIVDIQGVRALKELYDDVLSIFILPGDFSDLENRLRMRMPDKTYEIALRLTNAKREMTEHRQECDFQVVNIKDNLDNAIEHVFRIIEHGQSETKPILGIKPDKIIFDDIQNFMEESTITFEEQAVDYSHSVFCHQCEKSYHPQAGPMIVSCTVIHGSGCCHFGEKLVPSVLQEEIEEYTGDRTWAFPAGTQDSVMYVDPNSPLGMAWKDDDVYDLIEEEKPKLSWEEQLKKRLKENPRIIPFKVLQRFQGDAKVQCVCGNTYEYMRDEVSCRKCTRLFPMGDFKHD